MSQVYKKSTLKPLQQPKKSQNQSQKMHASMKSCKFENNIIIKPSSGYDRKIDYRFQTEEEIQTQQQCRKFQNQLNSQKKNNSFSNTTSFDQQIDNHPKSKKRVFDFYNCDSLAIRPSGKNQLSQKKYNQNLMDKIILPQINDFVSQNDNQLIKKENKILSNDAVNNLQKSLNYQSTLLQINNIKSLKPRRNRKIFEKNTEKQQNFKFYQPRNTLPFALMSYSSEEHQKRVKNMGQKTDQFHIVIQMDQITQCCF